MSRNLDIYDYDDYRAFFKDWLEAGPFSGRGGPAKVAELLRIHPSFVSQVIRSKKDLSQEQAFKVSSFMELSGPEVDYFIHLLLKDRAGTPDLVSYYQAKLDTLRQEARRVASQVGVARELSESDKARFYADALHTMVRVMGSIPKWQKPKQLAQALQVSEAKVEAILDFLVEKQLCTRSAEGNIAVGPQKTHIPQGSPLANTHHRNWRQKAIQFYEQLDDDDLVFTAPLSIAKADFLRVRHELLAVIKNVTQIVEGSECEEFVVFNIDWLRFKG